MTDYLVDERKHCVECELRVRRRFSSVASMKIQGYSFSASGAVALYQQVGEKHISSRNMRACAQLHLLVT
jgi:hypothetical protein